MVSNSPGGTPDSPRGTKVPAGGRKLVFGWQGPLAVDPLDGSPVGHGAETEGIGAGDFAMPDPRIGFPRNGEGLLSGSAASTREDSPPGGGTPAPDAELRVEVVGGPPADGTSCSPWNDEGFQLVPPGSGALRREGGQVFPLRLYRKETEGYRDNLLGRCPSVYLILRPAPSSLEPVRITACPFEAQDYADDGETPVEAIPMPAMIRAWIEAFVRRHHVEEPRRKRSRVPHGAGEAFSRPPRRPGSSPERIP